MKGEICVSRIQRFGSIYVNVMTKMLLMLWWISALSSCRGGRGAESISFNNESFGDFSEVVNHVRDVTLREMWCLRKSLGFCGSGSHPCCRRMLTPIDPSDLYFDVHLFELFIVHLFISANCDWLK